MGGTYNAFGLIAIALITVLAVLSYGRKPAQVQDALTSMTAGLVFFVLLRLFTFDIQGTGTPVTQSVLPAVCLAVSTMTLAECRRLRVGMTLLLIAGGLLLSLHFSALARGDGYTGNPERSRNIARSAQHSRLDDLRHFLEQRGKHDRRQYAAGWLHEMPPAAKMPEHLRGKLAGTEAVVQPAWHTWITGLHRVRHISISVWYPGGTLASAASRLEYRARASE